MLESEVGGRSMIILSSRQDATPLVPRLSETCPTYHLDGLSVLASADLLEQIAFDGKQSERESLQRSQDIDFARRIAILLEGNPAAIRFVAPGLRKAKGDAEELLYNLLYGVFEPDEKAHKQFRFVRTVYGLFGAVSSIFKSHDSFIHPGQFGSFWTLMPLDLTYYYWFLYLHLSKDFQEGGYSNWISDEFRKVVERSQMALKLKEFWLDISKALIKCGIIQPAVIHREDSSELQCYHVHPIFTIIARMVKEKQRKLAQYAYVRQFILWGRLNESEDLPAMINAEWGGSLRHEDYVHNLNAVALLSSINDGDLDEEVERMGLSLFDIVSMNTTLSLYIKKQQQLFIPIYMKQLNRVLKMLETNARPGSIPTSSDLTAILRYSWTLNRLLKDRNQAVHIVDTALRIVDIWRAASPHDAILNPSQEAPWFQLRHAEAKEISQTNFYKAKELLERNLADDPHCPPNLAPYNVIRRWQLQNLELWVSCVVEIALVEGTLNRSEISSNARHIIAEFEPGKIADYISSTLQANNAIFETLALRDIYSWAIDREKVAVANFGALASKILSEPMFENIAYLPLFQNPTAETDVLSTLLNSYPEGTPLRGEIDTAFDEVEFVFRTLGEDLSASAALGPIMEREALSSTASAGWENLAGLHQLMFQTVVIQNENPDYKKGLTHLVESVKLCRGVDMPKKDLVITCMHMALCYNGMNQPMAAAKAVLRAIQFIPSIQVAEFNNTEDAEGFVPWIYELVAELDTLENFNNRRYMPSALHGFTGLSFRERMSLLNAIRIGKGIKARQEREAAELRDLWKMIEELKPIGPDPEVAEAKGSGSDK
jgi:hypothetical protein